jgi:hypothetical protein
VRSVSARRDDPQREFCYAWEKSLGLPAEPMVSFPVRKPFTNEFRAFHELTWRWAFERYGGGHRLVTATPPQLRYSYRLRRAVGHAGLSFGRNGYLRPVITFGQWGPTRKTLLHEQAHLLAWTKVFDAESHGPRFCEIALALYEEFFNVDRAAALLAARAHGLAIAGSLITQAAAT